MGCPFSQLDWDSYIDCCSDNGYVKCPIHDLCESKSVIAEKIHDAIESCIEASEKARLLYEADLKDKEGE